MANIGKAKVKIGLGDALPNVTISPESSTFDLPSGYMKAAAENSDRNAPQSIDSETLEGSFTVLFPSKGIHYVNNYVDGDLKWDIAQTTRKVVWAPTDSVGTNTILNCFSLSSTYTLMQPSRDYATNTSYDGPRWMTRPANVGSKENPEDYDNNDFIEGQEATKKYSTAIEQYQSTPGMWWGVETSVDFPDQTGMWLNINLGSENKVGKASFIVVNINPSGTTAPTSPSSTSSAPAAPTDSFSIVITEQGSYLVDYYNPLAEGAVATSTDPNDWNKFHLNGCSSITGVGALQIGVLPMVGYLVVYLNGTSNVYPRRSKEETSTLEHFTLKISKVQVHGRNSTVTINMAAMVFSRLGVLQPPVINNSGTRSVVWKGSALGPHNSVTSATTDSSYAIYPGPGGKISCGACCRVFTDPAGSSCPSSSVTDSKIDKMCPASMAYGEIEVTFVADDSSINMQNMNITMSPDLANCLGSDKTLPIKPPYLFRIRGNIAKDESPGADIPANISDVMSLSESWDSPDYVHVTHSVDVTLYNKGGAYNSLMQKSMGIVIEAGVGGASHTIFTGITLDASSSEVAGKETLTVHCKDYMELLETTMFLNCPYYDGMLDVNAAKDIAYRAGLKVTIGDGVRTGATGYFLPAGYSFTEPRLKWSSDTTLKDGLINVCKLGEKIFYFNEDGGMVITALQGGIAYEGPMTSSATFTSNPAWADFNVILDEKRVEKLVGSVVRNIFVTSWDRVRGAVIAYQDVSTANNVPYAKTLYVDQPAYGSVEAVRNWVNMISERVFKVPRRITFKTIQNDFSLKPLSFITVDGKMYRVKSLNRRFDAESNSITSDITAEWFGP